MNKFLVMLGLALVTMTSNAFAGTGTISSPETRGWVMEDGEYKDFWRTRAGKAHIAKEAAEKAQQAADSADRPALMEAYIKKYSWDGVGHDRARGIKHWNFSGSSKSTAELRKLLPAVGAVAVLGAAVGATGTAEAATVRLKDADGNVIEPEKRTEPGAVSSSYRTQPVSPNTAK